jgi:hypothetical protein
MATYGDFDGVWFTIQAIRMYHREVLDGLSFVVIDNDPKAATATALRDLGSWVPRYRYVPFGGYSGTAVRDLIFRETDADIVCCVDSHVLLSPGALEALRDWFDEHPDSLDLLQGPLLHDDLDPAKAVTHLEPTWGAGMFGQWGRDKRLDIADCAPFEIAMQGLGVFACLRSAWPGLNPRLRGFGAEEGYLHETFRRRGGRVLCHPRLSWVHRFSRPLGIAYPNRWEDRVRNYLVAWGELGWDVAPMEAHFLELLGSQCDVPAMVEVARRQVEDPLSVFDAVFCLADGDAGCDDHAHPPAIAWRVERLGPGVPVEGVHRRLSGWHDALAAASARGYQHVLLLPDQSGPDTLPVIGAADWERPWDLCLLALADPLAVPTPAPVPAPAPRSFTTAGGLALAGLAVAVHSRAFQGILADLGSDEAGRRAFLATWPDLETYLLRGIVDGVFSAIGEPFAEPAIDRPVRAAELEIAEVATGLMVHRGTPPRAHQLNNTASIVLTLCDGERTVAGVAAELAESFALATAPLAEVSACVDGLRRAGILLARTASNPQDAGTDRALEEAARRTTNPFTYFDGIFCLNLDTATDRWREAARRHGHLGIAWKVERFAGIATPDNPHRGIAASFRRMIVEAGRRGYEHLLVLEDDAVFLDDTLVVLSSATAELASLEWDLCFLGACVWSQEFPFLGDSTVLQACGPVTCTHAVAVHARAYSRLVAEIPTDARELDFWLGDYLAIDQYLSRRIADGTYRALITSPRVASQANLLEHDDADGVLGARYVI